MKLKYNFVTNEIAGKTVAVAVGDDAVKFNGFIKMNETGAQIFDILKNETSMEDLVAQMLKIYPDEDESTVKTAVENFVKNLKGSGVLENA